MAEEIEIEVDLEELAKYRTAGAKDTKARKKKSLKQIISSAFRVKEKNQPKVVSDMERIGGGKGGTPKVVETMARIRRGD